MRHTYRGQALHVTRRVADDDLVVEAEQVCVLVKVEVVIRRRQLDLISGVGWDRVGAYGAGGVGRAGLGGRGWRVGWG